MTGLEAFEVIDNEFLYGVYAQETYEKEISIIKKELKALEIIKKKSVKLNEIKFNKDYEQYKLRMSSKYDTEIVKIDWNDKHLIDYLLLLTEEEFEILKEVLE